MSKLYFYHGVMDSGKSAHIIMQVFNLRSKGFNVLVLKSKTDTRDYGFIKSRAIEEGLQATLIDEHTDLIQLVKKSDADFLYVDEVNFLKSKVVEKLSSIVDIFGIPVFTFGLLTDYTSKQFEGSKRMVELADSVREMKSKCLHCQKKATMHLRKVNGSYVFKGDSVIVGDTDSYESVCRTCYMIAKDKSDN